MSKLLCFEYEEEEALTLYNVQYNFVGQERDQNPERTRWSLSNSVVCCICLEYPTYYYFMLSHNKETANDFNTPLFLLKLEACWMSNKLKSCLLFRLPLIFGSSIVRSDLFITVKHKITENGVMNNLRI